jgi:glycosyltransferase involved in cell wall biosynthesis
MNLLFLDQFSEPGGAQQCLLDLLPAMPPSLVGMPGNGAVFRRVRELGHETARIDCGPYRSGAKTAGDRARFLLETPRLARQIRELARGSDLVYINGPRLLPAAALAGIRAPVLFHSHSWIPPGATRAMCGWALRKLKARVIASCRYVAEPWLPYAREITVIYNGVAAPERPLPPRAGPFTIGCIGRIAPEKGQREFVEAARLIHRERLDVRFAIFGATMFGPEAYETEVRAAAAELPIEFRGWVENVYDALAAIDVLLVPSAPHEATTRVILEAATAGVPVVAFASGGIPEVLPEANLAHSVKELARKAMEVPRSGGNCNFTVARYRAEILNVLRNVASCPSRAGRPIEPGEGDWRESSRSQDAPDSPLHSARHE